MNVIFRDMESKSSSRLSLIVVAVFVIAVAAMEIAGRFFVAPTRLENILAILERDKDLLWRLRPGLDTRFQNAVVRTNARHLRGPEFSADKPPGLRRVICMGASPTFGWGVEEGRAYPAVLGAELARLGISAETINGGVPGYTTWQGRNWLKRDVLSWKPDSITVAYDLNDLDRFRFFRNDGRPDEQEAPASAVLVRTQNAANRSAAYRLFRRLILSAKQKGGGFDPEKMPRRVPLEQYKRNLLEIERTCRGAGIEVVFLKMPINLPFHRLAVADARRAADLKKAGDAARARGDAKGALAAYEESQRLDPTAIPVYEALADALEKAGQPDRAAAMREFVPFVAAFRDRADLSYNQAVAEIAKESERPMADVVSAFEADGRGDGLWNSKEDPFHPNAAGHEIIGKLLAEMVAPLLKGEGKP